MVHEYTELKNARIHGVLYSSNVQGCPFALWCCHRPANTTRDSYQSQETKDKANFEAAVSLIIGDLMMAAVREEGGWAYRSVSKRSFSDDLIKGDTFNSLMNSLGELGYLDSVKGGNHKSPFNVDDGSGFYPGMATRFQDY